MKTVMTAVVLSLCVSVSNASMKATDAISQLVEFGSYQGSDNHQSCQVVFEKNLDSVITTVITKDQSQSMILLDTASNYSVIAETDEITASSSLNAPHYIKGGTLFLNIKKTGPNKVQVSMSSVLLDHQGNDLSTFLSCTVTTK